MTEKVAGTEVSPFDLADDNRQDWMRKYRFAPRGIGFLEPGVVPMDHPAMSAYNIAKSAYQIRPGVFNLEWLSRRTHLAQDEIERRIHRLYDEHLLMLVMNPATQLYGRGLYYWFVKLKGDTSPQARQEFARWYQSKDPICTGYAASGAFDFFNGCHMRVLDNLLWDVVLPLSSRPEVESIRVCPVRRDIRESRVNMWDAPGDSYRDSLWGPGEAERLAGAQQQLDAADIELIQALNEKRPMRDFFDFQVLADISGLNPVEMEAGIREVVEQKRILVPLVFVNWQKLGLVRTLFAVRLFQIVPAYRKAEIADELAAEPHFTDLWEFTDSHFDFGLMACKQTADVDALRSKIRAFAEVEEVQEADVTRQFRRWVCRLDESDGFWEECVFPDDFLQDLTGAKEVRP
jgi:hypothetical protein